MWFWQMNDGDWYVKGDVWQWVDVDWLLVYCWWLLLIIEV